MSAGDTRDRKINQKHILSGALAAFTLCCAIPGMKSAQAEPAASDPVLAFAIDGSALSMEELRQHAATIDDILRTASERVERLAATEGVEPQLVQAIRQELSLSRRWNRHLETILIDVAEARRVLGEREREAAREIARMTAVAEEARLELVELKNVLERRPPEAEQGPNEPSGGSVDKDARASLGDRLPSSSAVIDPAAKRAASVSGETEAARAMLASMQEAQKSVARDVDAVRAKIIDALQTLASARGDLPISEGSVDAELSSEDITGWAASVATRLGRTSGAEAK